MNEKDKADIQKQIDEAVDNARKEWAKTRGWRHDRWASIKADWQAAGIMAAAGAVAWHFAGPAALRALGF